MRSEGRSRRRYLEEKMTSSPVWLGIDPRLNAAQF